MFGRRKRVGGSGDPGEGRSGNLPDGVAVGSYRASPEGRLLDANPALIEMLGYPSREALLAATAADLFADLEGYLRWRSRLKSDGSVRDAEVELRRFDGGTAWARHVAQATRDRRGRVLHYEGSLTDITERKRAQLELEESEHRFHALLAHTAEGILFVDIQHGALHAGNATLCQLLGYADEEIRALAFPDLVPTVELVQLVAQCHGQERAAPVLLEDILVRRKEGTFFPADLVAFLLRLSGRACLAVGIRDVTERTLVERVLQESRRFVREITDVAPVLFYVWDCEQRRCLRVNRRIEALGYSPEPLAEPVLHLLDALVHPDDRPTLDDLLQRSATLKDGERLEGDWRLRHAGGQWHWLRHRLTVFQRGPEGSVQQVLGMAHDIVPPAVAEPADAGGGNRFRSILEHASLFLVLLAPDGTVLEASRTALEFAEPNRAGVLGRPFQPPTWRVASAPGEAQLREAVAEAAQGRSVRCPVDLVDSEGRTVTVGLSFQPVLDEQGQVANILVESNEVPRDGRPGARPARRPARD